MGKVASRERNGLIIRLIIRLILVPDAGRLIGAFGSSSSDEFAGFESLPARIGD